MKNFTTKSAFLKSTCQNVKTLKVDELFIKKANYGLFCDFTTILNNETDNKKIDSIYQFPIAKINELGVVKTYQPLSNDTILTSLRLKQWCEDETNISFSYDGGERIIKDIEQIKNGNYIFYKKNITTFDKQLTSLIDGQYMFYYCESLTSFNSPLDNLSNGASMFFGCSSLTSFNGSLNSLTDGRGMFYGCTSLKSFNETLPNLEYAPTMFNNCSSLKSFNTPLAKLTNSRSMFCACTSLTSFNGSLSNLDEGNYMFYQCSSLTSFNGSLNSLTQGVGMFYDCKLDLASVQNIASTINDLASQSKTGDIYIGIKSSIKGNSSLNAALTTIRNKGWTVTEQYN